jgi:predicted O-methyltransferase YrrM
MAQSIRAFLAALRQRRGFRHLLFPVHSAWRLGVNARGLALRNSLLRRAARIPSVAPGDQQALDSIVGTVNNEFAGYVFATQMPRELRTFLEIIGNIRPAVFLEIGTARGGTLFALSRVVRPDAQLISLDLPGGQFGGGYPRWKTKLYQGMVLPTQRIDLIRGDSHDVTSLRKVKEALGGKLLDAMFIDGDHLYEGVKTDFEMYGQLVRPGGIIGFHDIVEHPNKMGGDVPRFWKEIISTRRHQELIEDPASGFGIGVLFV